MPKTIVITGSAGLIGSEASRYFSGQGYDIVGIDNNMRGELFGQEASTEWAVAQLQEELGSYAHKSIDIRDQKAVDAIFNERQTDIFAIVHTAAQPSHDWAAQDPITDFGINANGTLNLLESYRNHSSGAAFIFTSTNKVYGDRPNTLSLLEEETRYEAYNSSSLLHPGIDESMPVDQCLHSLFGVSKLSADLLVQEYGRYFGLNTVCFRGGCLTGGGHRGTEMHGFLSYLMKCVVTGKEYRIFGHKGKQVRDNIHSSDLVCAVHEYIEKPRMARVYNIGGGRQSNCSMLEAIDACESRAGRSLSSVYIDQNRIGDHRWYISDLSQFTRDYPNWKLTYTIDQIFDDIYDGVIHRIEA
ncbi:MAG: CDP-paratose 2-epimerase [Verrucomicrobia subdivision 3 bacterium]|nr:CDP-paratose 2-epimerase [Limisphaerales bacterium]MCS1415853.1 CDP-paratose 2-epimerase [Limisphaerales bacterium]